MDTLIFLGIPKVLGYLNSDLEINMLRGQPYLFLLTFQFVKFYTFTVRAAYRNFVPSCCPSSLPCT
jgi:hypothetical protein